MIEMNFETEFDLPMKEDELKQDNFKSSFKESNV